jgi:hypothetical protein
MSRSGYLRGVEHMEQSNPITSLHQRTANVDRAYLDGAREIEPWRKNSSLDCTVNAEWEIPYWCENCDAFPSVGKEVALRGWEALQEAANYLLVSGVSNLG